MKLIVGLGNPGKQYTRTRHNVGFMVLDALRDELTKAYTVSNWQLSKKFNADVCGTTISGEKIILAKPMTFMNASGQSVQLIGHFYKMTHRDIIVVHDDKDLPLGTIKAEPNRGHAGHNGVRSIIEHLGTQNIMRIRVGVASENENKMRDVSKFVLRPFGMFEKKKLKVMIAEAVEELQTLIG